jgi:hypothetical protein
MRIHLRRAILVALVIVPRAAGAQSVDEPARKQAAAMRVAAGSIRIDGRLDEEIWLGAVPVTDFTKAEPEEGARPTDPMEVRFVYDDDAL